jgi:phage terminase large subunit-like protein
LPPLRSFNREQQKALRLRCKTDLFFLAKEVLNKRFTEFTHRAVCDFFVKKDPSFKTFREFADNYKGPKDRLILLPRKGYKSTAKVIDNLQWNICWPEISIITLTAERGLAKSFVSEFQDYWVIKKSERDENGKIKGGLPTLFQELFREFCITENEATSLGTFTSPARPTFSKEATVGAFSIGMSGSGWSCDIIDFDDVLSDDNTQSGMQLDKLEKRIAMATKLRKMHGFRHIVGTRYDPLDAYGIIAESNGAKALYGDFESGQFKYMCRPCWWLKGHPFLQPDYRTWVPNAADVDLFFPEDLTFPVLAKELRENPDVFFSQDLNDPIEASRATYTEDLLRSCFIDHTQLPKQGETYIHWDLAYSTKKQSDYTVGTVGFLDTEGRWWIIALLRGRFNRVELPFQIVNGIRNFKPKRSSIENCNGAEWLTTEIERIAKDMNVELNLEHVATERSEDAKTDRMCSLHPLMAGRRLFFLNTIECADDLITEFKSVGNKTKRNDIPDSISCLVKNYSSLASRAGMPTPEEDSHAFRELEERDFYNMIFGRGRYEPRAPERPPVVEEPEWYTDPVTGLPSPSPL